MKILIVDDHQLFADGLALALEVQGLTTSKAATGAMALKAVAEQDFDLILLDITLPDIHGEVLLTSIKKDHAQLKIIIVSAANVDPSRIAALGANGFINKAENIDTVLYAIEAVVAGETHFDSHSRSDEALHNYALSPRQLEVIKAMSTGLSNKQIAHNLNISEGTVKQQISRIFKALDVKNRTQCTRKAEQLGLAKHTV